MKIYWFIKVDEFLLQSNYFDCEDEFGDARSELAAGTPILLDHALTHPLACSIQ